MRWFQYRLITLFALITLIAVGFGLYVNLVAPYRDQTATAELIKKLGGTYQTVEATEWWLRWTSPQHITFVNLADCDEPDQYIAAIGRLPRVELLLVGGLKFTDDHAARLEKLHSLKGLMLDSTVVTDEKLAALRAALPNAEVLPSERRSLHALSGKSVQLRVNLSSPYLRRELIEPRWFEEAISFSGIHVFPRGDVHEHVAGFRLVHLQSLRNLRELYLSRCDVSDQVLCNVARLSRLEQLWLENTKVTDAGLFHIKDLVQLHHLARTALRSAAPDWSISKACPT